MSCQKMKDRRFNDREEADMGIGTMIVFIAVILVSAIAAGMLINTAYLVANQAEETGRLAITHVATTIEIRSMMGDRNDETTNEPQDTLRTLEMMIALGAGSPQLAMKHLIIEVTTSTGEANLWFDEQIALQHEWDDYDPVDAEALQDAADDGTYTAMELSDPDDTFYEIPADEDDEPNFVLGQGALIRVFIDLEANRVTLGTQDWLAVKLIPKHGTPAYTRVVTPEAFTDRYVLL